MTAFFGALPLRYGGFFLYTTGFEPVTFRNRALMLGSFATTLQRISLNCTIVYGVYKGHGGTDGSPAPPPSGNPGILSFFGVGLLKKSKKVGVGF